jgi:hypothetical protein
VALLETPARGSGRVYYSAEVQDHDSESPTGTLKAASGTSESRISASSYLRSDIRNATAGRPWLAAEKRR